MATQNVEVNSVLTIEIGSIHTRAVLFDVVEESYQFIAAGSAPSTHQGPFFDVTKGIFNAISRLQEITGRFLVAANGSLIIPSHGSVEGVDRLLLTISCGEDLKAVTFGLLNDISQETVNKLVKSSPVRLVESFGINDRRATNVQMDALMAASPDILVFAGGTDRGATRSVSRMANMIHAVLELIPRDQRPSVLYCGNHAMTKRVRQVLEPLTVFKGTNNIRPEIDREDLSEASADLNTLVLDHKLEAFKGFDRILPICSDHPVLSPAAFHRITRFLGKQYGSEHGVLAIDLGAAHAVVSHANETSDNLVVLPLGLGSGLENLLRPAIVDEIHRWLPLKITREEVREILWQKTLYPDAIPATETTLAVEQVCARQILQIAMRELVARGAVTRSCFDPVLLSGSVFTQAATPQQALLTFLHGIQPTGFFPVVLDKHGILSMLGGAARIIPLLPVQVLESSAFVNLATVIVVESSSRHGADLVQATLKTAAGQTTTLTIKQGSLVSIPLAQGEEALLTLKPMKKIQIEDVVITDDPFKVNGGACGVVIDARERPLKLPADEGQRRDLLAYWNSFMGIS